MKYVIYTNLQVLCLVLQVTSPYGNNLHHNENETHGQFAFTTSESGNYLACFWKDGSHQQDAELTLGLDWKIGIAAKDWASVAKKEKIEVGSLMYPFSLSFKYNLVLYPSKFLMHYYIAFYRVLNLFSGDFKEQQNPSMVI